MKAAVLKNDMQIVFEEVPTPAPGPEQVQIRVNWSSVCGTDLHIYMGEFKNRVKYPRILGHEFAGVIESVGSAVQNLKPGDRVTVDPIIWCNQCPACLNGQNNVCNNLKLIGIEYDGGLRTMPLPEPTKFSKFRIRCPCGMRPLSSFTAWVSTRPARR